MILKEQLMSEAGGGVRLDVASADRPPHRIVVVGGGAGGLELATRLGDRLGRRDLAHVTLIDCSRTHLWKPLLHEFAAGTLGIDDQSLDYVA